MSLIVTKSAVALRDSLRTGAVSAVDVTTAFLEQIARVNPQLASFSYVGREQALETAAALDAARSSGLQQPLPPLWGMPLAHKDLNSVAGMPTSYGSAAFAGKIADTDDLLAVELRQSGAVFVGKTQVPEFGLSGYCENLVDPVARNPLNPLLTTGGSSGGAAAAVAAGMVPFALGSDAGGSIRIPAACCGVVGLKPTRAQLSIDAANGDTHLPLTVHGPLARTVTDTALLYAVLRDKNPSEYLAAAQQAPRKLRIAYTLDNPFQIALATPVSANIAAALELAAQKLAACGHQVTPITCNYQPGYYSAFSTAWRYLFGKQQFTAAQLALFGDYARSCYEYGRSISTTTGLASLSKTRQIAKHAAAIWAAYDVVLTPVLAFDPPPLGYFSAHDAETNFRLQCEWLPFTSIVNVAGNPALSVPVPGSHIQAADPHATTALVTPAASVQLIGKPQQELLLLQLGAQLSAAAAHAV